MISGGAIMSDVNVKARVRVPHTYVILFSLIILAAIGSYFIPAGIYERTKDERTGRTLVDPTSYHHVARTPLTPFKVVKSVPQGMIASATIVFFCFICGGAFSILQATGAVDAGVSKLILTLRGKEKLLIPITMLIFSILGTTIGMAESVIVFIPIGVALSKAMGFDDIVAVAILSTGAGIGFSSGMANPFTVGVAQNIAELPLFSGIQFRFVGHVALYLSAVGYTLNYANKIKKDPTKSLVYGLDRKITVSDHSFEKVVFSKNHILVLLVMILFFSVMITGTIKGQYDMIDMMTIFLGMGIIGGFLGGLSPNVIATAFVKGCASITFGAIVIGVSRGILIVLQEGQIIDTMINWLASGVQVLEGSFAAVGMFWVQSVINFFIPSGSGQAATTMPIMIPLADLIGITRQTAVMAFHYGDGFSNQIIPTSATLMAVLGTANVPYDKWVKFIAPLMVIWTAIGSALVFIAAIIELGPY